MIILRTKVAVSVIFQEGSNGGAGDRRWGEGKIPTTRGGKGRAVRLRSMVG
jgi:hypothetical protein